MNHIVRPIVNIKWRGTSKMKWAVTFWTCIKAHTHMSVWICVHIYLQRERERERDIWREWSYPTGTSYTTQALGIVLFVMNIDEHSYFLKR